MRFICFGLWVIILAHVNYLLIALIIWVFQDLLLGVGQAINSVNTVSLCTDDYDFKRCHLNSVILLKILLPSTLNTIVKEVDSGENSLLSTSLTLVFYSNYFCSQTDIEPPGHGKFPHPSLLV